MKTSFLKHLAKSLLLCFFYLLCANQLKAQNPTTHSAEFGDAIGIRLGATSGLTYKHKFDTRDAIEVIVGTRGRLYGITALYEANQQTGLDGLNLYAGFGGHLATGYYKYYGVYHSANNDAVYYRRSVGYGPVMGLDGIAGMEYKIDGAPLALSFDVKPLVEFYRDYGMFFFLDPGLGLKFTF